MEIKMFVYLGLAALYYGFKFWQKQRKQQQEKAGIPQVQTSETTVKSKDTTPQRKLQDFLKEFGVDTYETESDQSYERTETTESHLKPETRVDYNQNETREFHEGTEYQKSYEKKGTAQYIESVSEKDYKTRKLEKEIDKLRYEIYKSQEKQPTILEGLRNKKGLQRALIVSEILKKKF